MKLLDLNMRHKNIHVIPVNDLVEHTSDEDSFDTCICGPDTEFINGNWIIVHHSLDGREFHEHAE